MARWERLPAQIRSFLGGEKVLAWGHWQASRVESGYAVATARALHLIKPDADPTVIPWDSVVRASWDEPVADLVVQPVPGGPSIRRSITLPVPRRVPEAIRDRVTANIVHSTYVELTDQGGARLIARRTYGSPELRWAVVFDAGLDPSDPGLRARAESELATLRSLLGA